MPVSTNTSVLTGQQGALEYKPAGTEWSLLDYTDFIAATDRITVPDAANFKVGDPVKFAEVGTGNLDSALTAGTTYYVIEVNEATAGSHYIKVSATDGGSAVNIAGDGGTGSANTTNPSSNHVTVSYAAFTRVLSVRQWSLEITREELDVTTIGGGTGKQAAFRRIQSGFASGSGSMELYWETDDTTLANRLMSDCLLADQAGAQVRLYIDFVDGSTTSSRYIEADVAITSVSAGVSPDNPQSATVNFRLADQPVFDLSTSA